MEASPTVDEELAESQLALLAVHRRRLVYRLRRQAKLARGR